MRSLYVLSVLICLLVSSLSFALYEEPLSDVYLYTQAMWNMDSQTSGIIFDEDDQNPWRNNELELHNGASLVAGKSGFGNALNLDGTNDYAVSVYPWSQHRW